MVEASPVLREQPGLTQGRPGLPPGSCDTHVHVLDPARFPFTADRRYTPGPATTDALQQVHRRLGFQRVVLVQNSVYGSDHRCLLDALARLGPGRARGVTTIGATTTDAEIAELDRAGVRGARLNLEVGKSRDASAATQAMRDVVARIPATWHLHVNAGLTVLAAMTDSLAALPNQAVLDHFAHMQASGGVRQPGAAAVLDLLRSRKAIVKLSAPYQVSKRPSYDDVGAIARVLVETAPDQVIWGSDWPHTGGAGRPTDQPIEFVEPFRSEDDAAVLALLSSWVPDAAVRRRILVDTPALVYGFHTDPHEEQAP